MRRRHIGHALAVAVLLAGTAACGDESVKEPEMNNQATIKVTSPDIEEGGRVPTRFTCDGDEVSPALSWSGVPAEAEALALVVDDPDAPSGTFTHWVVLDIPPNVDGVDEDTPPRDGVQGKNSAGNASYFGPCPPSGTHRYRFTVYALSAPTGLGSGADLNTALRAVEDNALAWGRLTALYSR